MKKMVEEKYSTNLVKTKYVNDKKITDHYAIIPTGQGYENYDKLPELQKQIYKLIVERFIAIFYLPAEFNKVNVTVNVENETFLGTGKVCIKRGFLDVLRPEKKQEKEIKKDEEEEENTNLDVLNTLKKNEILQMLVLNPKLAILDETDSGLDVDAIKTVSKGVEMFKNDENAVLIITHNTKILHNLTPDFVHILVDGKIVKTGNADLAKEIEENGYRNYKK